MGFAPVATVLCASIALGQDFLDGGNDSRYVQPYLSPCVLVSTNREPADGTLVRMPSPAFMRSAQQPTETWQESISPGPGFFLGDLAADCDDCPKRGVVIFASYDSWQGVSDGGWHNTGISSGMNFGTRLGRFSDLTGIGFQIGGSAAAYDWTGTDYRLVHQNQAEPQGFITYGLFRKTTESSRWNAALVQDWMLNANFGVFAQNPTLSQWRGQLGYATSAWNEFGMWGAWRAHGDTRDVNSFGPISWRSVNQISAFWHHKWGPGGPDSSVWVGLPEHDRLSGQGSLGDYLVGISGNFPLTDRLAVYTLVTYMHPSAAAGPAGFDDDTWNFSIGISVYPGRNARWKTVAGQCWMPALPVANNGYFMVDTNKTF